MVDHRKRGHSALQLSAEQTAYSWRFDELVGLLDAAFNNASAGPLPAPLADMDPAEFDLGIATNVRGTFLGMKFQIPAMLRSGGGAIVNMASIAGLNGTANLAAYVAGKAGIIGLTKVAALDYADQGIRVNVVAPGPILTWHLEAAGEQAQRGAAQSTPMRRVGSMAEVASAVLWLCSDQSSFITGTVLPIDGGQAAGNKPPQMYRQGQPMQDQSMPNEPERMQPSERLGALVGEVDDADPVAWLTTGCSVPGSTWSG